MLPTSFDDLASSSPHLKPVFLRLKEWKSQHEDWSVLDTRVLARDMRDIDPFLLSLALQILVKQGLYRTVYMVATPTGVLAEDEYDEISNIPERVPDRFNEYFSTADADIVTVLKPAA